MKKLLTLLFLLIVITTFSVDQVYAISHAEIVQGRQTFSYNVQFQDKLKAMVFDSEWGLTETLGFGGRYIYASPKHFLDLFLKFKIIDNKDLDIAGRIGLMKNFSVTETTKDNVLIHKTLGVVITKAQNSYLTTNGGLDYSFDTRGASLFLGMDYRLTQHTYFQVGWEKLMSGRDVQGLLVGFRTDL